MATKTITIDLEAYNRLRLLKFEKESFSQAIKRLLVPPPDLDKFHEFINSASLSKEAFQAVREQIDNRHKPSQRNR